MLINDNIQFVKTSFDNESEIENVVQKYSEQLFGSFIIYLPQKRISTISGKGTIPDAIVIDVSSDEWFIVEAERAVHGTWAHIAPQISKQLAAVESTKTRELILEIALSQIKDNKILKTVFSEFGIKELDIHGKLQKILRKKPTIAIPIDSVPSDLEDWARTLRNTVKIWIIEKYICTSKDDYILYSLPEESSPTYVTEQIKGQSLSSIRSVGSPLFQEVLDGGLLVKNQKLVLEYGPRGKIRKTFEGTVRQKGIEVDGKVFSPSLAAVYCIQKAGSPRKTANGWTMWKTEDGILLDTLYRRLKEGIAGKQKN